LKQAVQVKKITRNRAENLSFVLKNNFLQEKYSDFRNKEELSNYMFNLAREGREEREEIRHSSRTRSVILWYFPFM